MGSRDDDSSNNPSPSSSFPPLDVVVPNHRYWRKLQQMLAVDSDAVVARVTAIRWASFAKSGDPNDDLWGSKQGSLEWPIWFDDDNADNDADNADDHDDDDDDHDADDHDISVSTSSSSTDTSAVVSAAATSASKAHDGRAHDNGEGREEEEEEVEADKPKQQQQQHKKKRRRKSVYTRWDGGPEYLEIGNPHVIRHVGRDCFCEFWDSLEYSH
jgi:hypothetical protein